MFPFAGSSSAVAPKETRHRNDLIATRLYMMPDPSALDSPKLSPSVPTRSHTSPFSAGPPSHMCSPMGRHTGPDAHLSDEWWDNIDHYLFSACTALTSRDTSVMQQIAAPKHRMGWYAVIYNACNGSPEGSRDMYRRLALSVLHIAEVFALYPILQAGDHERMRVVIEGVGEPVASIRGQLVCETTERSPPAIPTPGWMMGPHKRRSRSRRDSQNCDSHISTSSFGSLRRWLFRSSRDVHRNHRSPSQILHQTELSLAGGQQDSHDDFNKGRAVMATGRKPSPPASDAGSAPASGGGNADEDSSPLPIQDATASPTATPPVTPRPTRCPVCRAFLQAYETFLNFQRIVASCFGYLDQYYTRRFGMDVITMMCTKLFYVVAYNPVKGLLLREILDSVFVLRESLPHTDEAAMLVVAETLGIMSELLAMVKSTSSYLVDGEKGADPAVEVQGTDAPPLASRHGVTSHAQPSTPEVVDEEGLRMSCPPPPEVGGSLSNVECDTHSAMMVVDLNGLVELRARLESTALTDSLTRHAANQRVMPPSAHVPTGDDKENAPTATIVVELPKTLAQLVSDDFGNALISHAAAFYRVAREPHLSDANRRHYLGWVGRVMILERGIVRRVVDPSFATALFARLNQVLLVEVHRQLILDRSTGFQALLEVWAGGRVDDSLIEALVIPAKRSNCPAPAEEALEQFVAAFLQTGDENCVQLLSKILASMVMTNAAHLIGDYRRRKQAEGQHPGIAHGDHHRERGALPASCALMEALAELYDRYATLITSRFRSNPVLQQSLHSSFVSVLNPVRWGKMMVLDSAIGAVSGISWNRDDEEMVTAPLAALRSAASQDLEDMPLLLAVYGDMSWSSGEAAAPLPNPTRARHVACLVAFLDSKEAFIAHLKPRLARRLLRVMGRKPRSLLPELTLLREIQASLTGGLTHAINGMLRDCKRSEELAIQFASWATFVQLPTTFHVHLMTPVHWPAYSVTPLKPHGTLQLGLNAFRDFYAAEHSSRTLRWVYGLSTATLLAEFPKGKKELDANAHQATILLAVSDACNAGRSSERIHNTYSVSRAAHEGDSRPERQTPWRGMTGEDIAQALGLPFEDIRQPLASLVWMRPCGLLVRVDTAEASGGPAVKSASSLHSLDPADRLELNRAFEHPQYQVRVPVLRPRGMDPSADGVGESHVDAGGPGHIGGARTEQLSAALLRVLKSRRQIQYQELLDLATQQVSRLFHPLPRQVKVCLEGIISRGYARRSDDSPHVLEYVP